MATVTKDNAAKLPEPFAAPYGNLVAFHYKFATNASGVMVDSDQATAVVDGDIVRLGKLPAGFMPIDAKLIISDAFTTNVDFDIGFLYVDGVDVTAIPQDADYFFDGSDAGTAAVLTKATTTAPVTLPKEAWLTLTCDTEDNAAAGVADIFIIGIMKGAA